MDAGRAGLIAIGASIVCTFAVAVAGPSVMEPVLPGRPGQPPWSLGLHPSPYLVVALTAAGLAAGTLGLVLVLRAMRAGWAVPARVIVVAGLLAAAALTLVPPFGSSDHLSYAAYGRMLVTGHNPYTTTPAQLAALGDPIARAVQDWSGSPSVYGPLATAIQALASLIGGTSVRLTVFGLGLVNLAAFWSTALLLHRMTRRDPPRQLRAALLWAGNPLLLQVLVAGAHVDTQAVAFGVAAVVMMFGPWGSVRRAGTAAGAVTVWRAAAAGILVGLGFAVKVTVALAGLGLAIALVMRLGRQRRVVVPLAALGAGFAVTAGAAVAIGGSAMLRQSSQASSMVSIGSPWRVIRTVIHLVVGGTAATDIVKAGAIALTVVLAVLLIRGIPGILDDPAGPAAGPAAAGVVFALVLAWLFAWPYVLPWYDALGWALLPLIPLVSAPVADGIGWLLLTRTAALGFGYLPARATDVTMPPGLTWLQPVIRHGVTPVILAGATVWLVVLMVRSGHGRPSHGGRRIPGHTADPASTATKAGRVASWPPWAVTLLGVLAWVAALAAAAPLVRGYLTSPPGQRMVDLDVYRTGGLSVLQGQPLYTILTQPPQLLPFTYPPTAALFAVPLALLPWPVAQLVWVPVIYGPLAVVIWFAFAPLLRRAGSGRMQAVVFAVLFAACAYLFPLRDEMRFGQVDMVLLAMALADCAARAPRWPRGALVGLATAIKLVPGVFIVYLWLSGRRRAAVTAAIVALAWTLGAWLVLPQDSTTYWTSVIFQSGRFGSNAGTSNQSLRGILLREFLPGQAPGVVWAVLALAVAVAGFAVVSRLARESRQTEAIAVTALLGVLLSPVSWIHHFLVVVVVIGAILADGRSPWRTAIAAGTAVFFALTVPWAGQVLLGVHDVPVQAARVVQDAFGLAALALLVVIARLPATPDAAKKCQSGQARALSRCWQYVGYAVRLPGPGGHLLRGGAARRRPRRRTIVLPDHPGRPGQRAGRHGAARRGPDREFGRGRGHRDPR
jgi:hypothetical protein